MSQLQETPVLSQEPAPMQQSGQAGAYTPMGPVPELRGDEVRCGDRLTRKEDKRVQKRVRAAVKSSSTSSVFAVETMHAPNFANVIKSVSAVLHCQLLEDEQAPNENKFKFPEFDERTYNGGQEVQLVCPDDIVHFLASLFKVGGFAPECCIIILIYINRFCTFTTFALSRYTWRPLTVTALMCAQKVWDDQCLRNKDFNQLYELIPVSQLNRLEARFLELVQYKVHVKPALYTRYYFELRSLVEQHTRKIVYMRPLTKEMQRKLEQRSCTLYREAASRDKANSQPQHVRDDMATTPVQSSPYILS